VKIASYCDSEAMQTITVYNAQKTPQVLNTAFANGGEGTVYPLASRPDEVLVKIYHNQVLTKLQPGLQNKIAAQAESILARVMGFSIRPIKP
jgi:DNA-binding helix-hairpin-helix protein with protein kinase domain